MAGSFSSQTQKKTAAVFIRSARTFREDPFPRDVMPPFFLMQTMRLIEKNANAEGILFDMAAGPVLTEEIIHSIVANRIRIAVISFDSSYIAPSLELCREIKQKYSDVICIAVGHAATYCTTDVCYENSPVDYAVRGEYQLILSELIEKETQSSGAIDQFVQHGLIYSCTANELSVLHIIEDVNVLPAIALDKQEQGTYYNVTPVPCMKKLIWGWIFTTYGCPNECVFCTQTVRLTYGNTYRLRQPEEVVKEIQLVQHDGANVVEFMDDNFTSSRNHVVALCEEMIKHHVTIPWGAHVRIDDADYEMLKLMKDAGCVYVRCGVESGSPRVIQALSKTADPLLWEKRVRQFFQWAKDIGLCTIAYVILGGPDEEKEDVLLTKKLILSVEPDIVKVHSFCAYPGAKVFDSKKLQCSSAELSELNHHGFYRLHDDSGLWEDLENDFLRSFYFRPKYMLDHILKFFGFYFYNPHCLFVLFQYARKVVSDCFVHKADHQEAAVKGQME